MPASRNEALGKQAPVAVSPRLEAFLEMLAAERGAARLTLAAYQNDLTDLSGFLAAEWARPRRRRCWRPCTSTSLPRRPAASRRAPWRGGISAMRQFFRFLLTEGVRADDPTSGLDTPRLGRPLPKILTEAEVTRLIAAAEAWPGEEGVRLRCVLELLYATGLRISELVTLPLAAAQRDPRFLLVRGKGGKERVVPLSPPSREALTAYLTVRKHFLPEGATSRFLFPVARPRRLSHAPALRPAFEGAGAGGEPRPGAAVAACAAPRLRQPSPGSRRRSAQRPADARPRRYRDDADLYPCSG